MAWNLTQDSFRVCFRGVRGSYAVPRKDVLEYGGNTSCVELQVGGHLLILDAGTGLIALGKEIVASGKLRKAFPIYLFLTHIHHDHIQGLPFFDPAYIGTTRLYIYGPRKSPIAFDEAIRRHLLHPFFPVELEEMKSTKFLQTLEEPEVLILDHHLNEPVKRHVFRQDFISAKDPVIITVLRVYAHPNGGVNAYKIKWRDRTVVFATDVEGYRGGDSRLIKFASGCDLLIHDTHFLFEEYTHPEHPKQGFGHSTVEQACEVAAKAKVKQLALFHHAPDHSDAVIKKKEARARELFLNSFAAKENQVITIKPRKRSSSSKKSSRR